MAYEEIKEHLEAYKKHDQIFDAAKLILRTFDLEHENFSHFEYMDDTSPNSLILIADGNVGEKTKVRIPKNLFDFDFNLVANMLMHELYHVRQKAPENSVEDKNEREFQAYSEMLFHKIYPLVPEAPLYNQKQFAEKALEYYRRMGEGSELQEKYRIEKEEVEKHLENVLILRGEKKAETDEK